jgi:hypothetical protein
MLYQIHLTMNGVKPTTLVVIGTDCTGSDKHNYLTVQSNTNVNIKFSGQDAFLV